MINHTLEICTNNKSKNWADFVDGIFDFSFCEMLASAIESAATGINEKGQKMIVDISEDVPTYVVADHGWMHQLVSHLISNASLVTPLHRNIRLQVSRLQDVDGMCHLIIIVQDKEVEIEVAYSEIEDEE